MIALRASFFAAAALSLPLAIGTPTAHAGPALSELSDVADYNQDPCAQAHREVSRMMVGTAFQPTDTRSWPTVGR
jgi:hypothetical protein